MTGFVCAGEDTYSNTVVLGFIFMIRFSAHKDTDKVDFIGITRVNIKLQR